MLEVSPFWNKLECAETEMCGLYWNVFLSRCCCWIRTGAEAGFLSQPSVLKHYSAVYSFTVKSHCAVRGSFSGTWPWRVYQRRLNSQSCLRDGWNGSCTVSNMSRGHWVVLWLWRCLYWEPCLWLYSPWSTDAAVTLQMWSRGQGSWRGQTMELFSVVESD